MPLRNDPTVWYNMPGVVAAYQPQYAPGFVTSLQNMRNGGDAGYTAMVGVAPTHNPVTGWTFNGISQYLKTDILPDTNRSIMVQLQNVPAVANQTPIGGRTDSNNGLFIISNDGSNNNVVYRYGDNIIRAPAASGTINLCRAGVFCFRNGVADGAAGISSSSATLNAMYLGALNSAGSPGVWFAGVMSAVVIFDRDRILTPSEVWDTYLQMAHLNNPAWSAWARKRQYYYAPAAAAIRWPGVGRGGPVGGSIGIRGSMQ